MNSIRLNTKVIGTLSDVLYLSAVAMQEKTDIANTTWYALMQRPDGITIQQLLAIANGLHIPVRRFFSFGKVDFVGRRDDYVTDPYLDCRYDADALQEIVNNRPAATWKKASDATGITPINLRKSLLAVRRTPVTRFLIACQALDIDPFTILIDPNPLPKRQSRRGTTQTLPAGSGKEIHAELCALREDVRTLSATVADLAEKYKTLLADHEKLARRVSVNIENINSSYIGIAAEK